MASRFPGDVKLIIALLPIGIAIGIALWVGKLAGFVDF